MSGQRRKFTPEYRRRAAMLVIETGRPIAHVAKEIGVGAALLGRRVGLERDRLGRQGDTPLTDEERAELARLRKEVVELRLDRDTLKSGGLLCDGTTPEMKYALILKEKANFHVARMVRLLRVSRSGYYAWRGRSPSARAIRSAVLTEKITQSHKASTGVYGAPRVTADLRAGGVKVSVKAVAKLMTATGIAGIPSRSFKPVTTIKDARAHTIPDLVSRRFDTGAIDTVWTSDITYLKTRQGFGYLCVIRDAHSRRILGRVIADHLTTDLIEDTLRQAVTLRNALPSNVILHAGRGCQFTSRQLHEVAQSLGITISVGRTGACWDNAPTESFWSTFKHEFYYRHRFDTITQARTASYRWIDEFYNTQRRHSKIGMLTPLQYEQLTQQPATQAA